ncbi:MAG: aldehyde dehydrogenase family protein [Phycisphaerae bacterium]|nr:aldehyde dehydrogenase family protein [Phycisphaerae bacterium]
MRTSLILVDIQNDYLAASDLQPSAEVFVKRIMSLLEECRRRQIPVIHVWTTVRRDKDERLPHWQKSDRWVCVAGTEGHRPPRELRVLEGETVVEKTGFNAFADGELDKALKRVQCDTVIIAGLHLHACVRTVAVECLERGYHVYIAEDAAASNDPTYSASTYRWLSDRCVVFEPWKSILSRPDRGASSSFVHRSPRCVDEILFERPTGGADDAAAEAGIARDAFKRWSRTAGAVRQQALEAVSDGLEAMRDELAGQMAMDIGKPLSHCHEEISRAICSIGDVVRRAGSAESERRDGAGSVRYRPVGVVAIITAWNNPVAVPLGKIAPALAFGNTVVWKPAPAATRVAEAMIKLLRDSGIPEDVVRLLTGDHTTARRLADDANINAVTLTGSIRAGYAIQEICSRRMLPIQAELSGNNAAIVWDYADIAHAAGEAAWGAFAFAGQRCTANRRVIVHSSMLERFLGELETAANQLVCNDPLNPGVDIGPVISPAKRAEIEEIVEAVRSGNQSHRVILTHGANAEQMWFKRGAYVRPAIICCAEPGHAVVQEETMGPVLVVQQADDFDQALDLCNGVRHGLAASLFSDNEGLLLRFLEEAQAGVLKLNSSTAGVDATLPFGGWKQSGIGPPEHGEGDRSFYTQIQTVYGGV